MEVYLQKVEDKKWRVLSEFEMIQKEIQDIKSSIKLDELIDILRCFSRWFVDEYQMTKIFFFSLIMFHKYFGNYLSFVSCPTAELDIVYTSFL